MQQVPGTTSPNSTAPRNLIINYLPADCSDQELQQLFSQFGEVESARVIMEPGNPPKSKGYGFVKYVYPQGAENALKSMNGFALRTKRLKVSVARLDGAIPPGRTRNTPTPPQGAQSGQSPILLQQPQIVAAQPVYVMMPQNSSNTTPPLPQTHPVFVASGSDNLAGPQRVVLVGAPGQYMTSPESSQGSYNYSGHSGATGSVGGAFQPVLPRQVVFTAPQ